MLPGDGQDDRDKELWIILVVVLVTAWIFVLLRAYTRFFMVKNVAADDWWMFAAMIAYTGYSFDAIYGTTNGGTGKHISQLSNEEIYIGLKTWYISEILYAPVSAMVRTSVALFLLRVSVEPLHRAIIIANLTIVWVVSIVFLFVVTFQCDPPRYFYDQILGLQGHCLDVSVVPNATIAHSVIGAVCDLVFASLPVAMLWNVQMNKRTKVVIALLLGMGGVAGIALFVRIPFVRVLAISPDFLYETIDVAIWSVLEPSLGIIAGCAATFRPIFKSMGFGRNTTNRYYGGYSSRSRRTRYGGGSGPGSSSNRTWLSSIGAGPKRKMMMAHGSMLMMGGGGASGAGGAGAPDAGPPTAAALRRWTWSSIHSGDIEMQRPDSAAAGEAVVETKIVGNLDPEGEGRRRRSAEDSGLQGISVQTTIHTESVPVAMLPPAVTRDERDVGPMTM